MMRGRFVAFLVPLILGADVCVAQTLTPALDFARRQPIVEGQGLGGIQIGDTEEEIRKKMGSPLRVHQSPDGLKRDLRYAAVGPGQEWGIIFDITLTLARGGAEAILLIVVRRPPTPYEYLGHTTRGYRPGEPPARALALYGKPDEILAGPPGSDELWWYRSLGLLIVPGERSIMGQSQAKLAVIRRNLTPAELRGIVLGP